MDTSIPHHIHFLRLALGLFVGIGLLNFAILDMQAFKTLVDQKRQMHVSTPNQTIQTPLQGSLAISPTQAAAPIPTALSVITEHGGSTVKEFFVPFGQGSSMATDWTDVAALQATIDSSQYGQIKQALFEASMRIPTGNEHAYVRLFDVTDKHPVWYSEVSIEGGTAQSVTSSPVKLDPGMKTYQVQMKTSLDYQAILDQARLHILVN